MAYRIQPVPHPDLATPLRIDHEVMPCLRRMMRMGIAIDIPYLQDLGSQFAAEIKRLEDDIKWSVPAEALELLLNEDTGDIDLNVGSPEQVAWLLFDVLELGKGKRLKFAKSTGRLATDKKQLELIKAENPIVRLLLRYRRLSKLKSTYCDALPRLAVPHPRGPDCPVCGRRHNESHPRIHTAFSTTRALTGRLASSSPNLQNIPARTDEGVKLRLAFVPSPGYRLISCDYSQIELRVFAHSSRDEYMTAIYQAEEDLHVETAKQAFGLTDISAIPKDEFKQKYRNPSKCVNFGVAYGMTGVGLMAQLVLNFSEADLPIPDWLTEPWCDAFIEKWFNVFPGVKAYLEHEHYCARKYGFVWTNYGRVRLTLETKSLYDNVRSEGYRQAGNHRIQGTAADINKMGLTAVHEQLAHWRKTDLDVEGLLTVHDEWVGEAPEDMAEVAAEVVKEEMESVAELRSNLVAEAGTMERWKK